MTFKTVFLENVVPALGGVIGVLLFLSPLKAVLRARREKAIGDLNPLPFPVLLANCVGWVAYAFVIDDIYVYVPNEIGLVLGAFYTLSCYGLVDSKSRDRQLLVFLVFAALLSVVGAIGVLGGLAHNPLKLLWGFTTNAILVCFYSAPLSTVRTVIRTRCSATLHWPLLVMNVINGSLWTAYGIAVTDYFIWVPNCTGAVLAVFMLILRWIYPTKNLKVSPSTSESEVPSSTASREPLTAASATLELGAEEKQAQQLGGEYGSAVPAGGIGRVSGAPLPQKRQPRDSCDIVERGLA